MNNKISKLTLTIFSLLIINMIQDCKTIVLRKDIIPCLIGSGLAGGSLITAGICKVCKLEYNKTAKSSKEYTTYQAYAKTNFLIDCGCGAFISDLFCLGISKKEILRYLFNLSFVAGGILYGKYNKTFGANSSTRQAESDGIQIGRLFGFGCGLIGPILITLIADNVKFK